jgi:hypothetical protein
VEGAGRDIHVELIAAKEIQCNAAVFFSSVSALECLSRACLDKLITCLPCHSNVQEVCVGRGG